nr:hypothetical protein [uncultured Kingella sp.]
MCYSFNRVEKTNLNAFSGCLKHHIIHPPHRTIYATGNPLFVIFHSKFEGSLKTRGQQVRVSIFMYVGPP